MGRKNERGLQPHSSNPAIGRSLVRNQPAKIGKPGTRDGRQGIRLFGLPYQHGGNEIQMVRLVDFIVKFNSLTHSTLWVRLIKLWI